MRPTDPLPRLLAWVVGPRGVMAFAATLLFLVMAVSFLNIPWPTGRCGGELCEIPATGDGSLGQSLFGPFAILVLVMALTLAAAMIGGVYLAKEETSEAPRERGGPPP